MEDYFINYGGGYIGKLLDENLLISDKAIAECKTKGYRLSGGEFEDEASFKKAFEKLVF